MFGMGTSLTVGIIAAAAAPTTSALATFLRFNPAEHFKFKKQMSSHTPSQSRCTRTVQGLA